MVGKRVPILFAFLFCLTFLLPHTSTQTKYNWKFDRETDGCQIFTSEVPNQRFIASKCVSIINARIDEIGVVLRDIQNFPAWIPDCIMSRILMTLNDEKDIIIFYLQQKIPILANRDMVLKTNVVLNYDKGHAYIGVDQTGNVNYPSPDGFIRMEGFNCSWFLEYIDREHTRATYIINPNLGGKVPGAFANHRIKELSYKTMLGMKRIVKEPKYIEAAKTSKYRKLLDESIKSGKIK